MSYQQKSTISSLVGLLVSFGAYAIITISRYQSLALNTGNDAKFLSIAFLLLIPVLFVFQLLSYIVYLMFESKENRNEIRMKDDEMDKMIDYKITNISLYIMIFGFFVSISLLIFSLPLRAMFIGMGLSVLLGSICGFIAKYVYYTRGM